MPRLFISAVLLVSLSFGVHAQTPGHGELHRPSSFDNSFEGSLPDYGPARSGDDGRYGFLALFELRIAPGIVKSFDVRQFFPSEQLSVQGFLRLQSAMPSGTVLVHVDWLSPTTGESGIGN